ncbi:hypothetical protein F2Q68_00042198 [Brassica cretica]|uniref:Uncharacterized protein n=1 Tax=Brassica cretica TaxID=69181 RepID=A0A8S9MDX5_BRACR|nr:hypothetical protein F2Q68_00042198 [Brassica cretica]
MLRNLLRSTINGGYELLRKTRLRYPWLRLRRFLWCPFVLDSSPSMRYIRQLTKLTHENAGGFTSLIKIPPTQEVELLCFSDSLSSQAVADHLDISPLPLHSYWTLIFPSNSAILDRAVSFSVIANEQQQNGNVSGELILRAQYLITPNLIWIESKRNKN